MRFLQGLDDRQIVKWSDHYVQYQLLRTRVRTTAPEEAVRSWQDEQNRVAQCHAELVDILKVQAGAIIDEFNIPASFDQETPAVRFRNAVEQEGALLALREFREHLQELHWFEYVNEQALRLLRRKIERQGLGPDRNLPAEDGHFPFRTRNDRIQLREWDEQAIHVVRASAGQPHIGRVRDLDGGGDLAIGRDNLMLSSVGVHRLIQHIGRQANLDIITSAPGSPTPSTGAEERRLPLDLGLSATLASSIFVADSAWEQRDELLRTPLYYAAYYGLVHTTQVILNRMAQAPTSADPPAPDPGWGPDHVGRSPLHGALFRRQTKVVEMLLNRYVPKPVCPMEGSDLTVLAIKAQSDTATELLIRRGVGLGYRDRQGRGPLHHAARRGQDRHLASLVDRCSRAELNEVDKNGLSPLAYAAMHGHGGAVDLLLARGADAHTTDRRHWASTEYAAHKGHMKVAERLNHFISPISCTDEPREKSTTHPPRPITGTDPRNRMATNGLHVLVLNIGTLDSRKAHVDLQMLTLSTPLGLALELSTCGDAAPSFRELIHLPVLESTVNCPFVIETQDPDHLHLLFRLLDIGGRNVSPHDGQVLGTGVVVVHTLGTGLGRDRESLMREATVPITDVRQNLVATFTFSFLMVRPFIPTQVTSGRQGLHETMDRSSIIGHRGFGQNALRRDRPRVQLGENTLQSFRSAHGLGVRMVEFDVQMTADLVPVVYHDFLVSETGTDAPVHIVTLEQFRQISRSQQQVEGGAPTSEKPREKRSRSRAFSLESYDERRTMDLTGRLKETYHFQLTGFKGNTRGDYVQEPITTLEELLKELPVTLGFNIELKYPMLFEADDWHMPPYSIEINTYVDRILELCCALGGARRIILSSFSPEVCIALRLKQQTYPVVFISDGGLFPTGDERASTFQQGVHFTRHWGLAGVAMMADPFVLSRKLVAYVHAGGLYTMSHGRLNNDPEHVQTQAQFGVDGLIVDDIVRVRRALDGYRRALAMDGGVHGRETEPN